MSDVVLAWRTFVIHRSGRLLPPFLAYLYPELVTDADFWRPGPNVARCAVQPFHEPPEDGCTCGLRGVPDLGVLVRALSARTFRAVSPADAFRGRWDSVLEQTGLLAKVRLSGRVLPDDDPVDPPGTLRAERAELLELHLEPTVWRTVRDRGHLRDLGAPRFTYPEDSRRSRAPRGERWHDLAAQGVGAIREPAPPDPFASRRRVS